MSRFAISSGRSAAGDSQGGAEDDAQEAQMERAMLQMASEMEHVNEDDPKAMARMMRKLMETSGMNMGEGMDEAIRRLEAGEDPDQVEEQLGDVLDNAFDESSIDSALAGDEATLGVRGAKMRRMRQRLRGAPRVDPEVYDM